MSKIRTRFAPSPTGYMHVGNLRTALYAYLIAKHEGGDFILRIEDTDQERYVEGAVDVIFKTLRDTGLIHDEGPDVGGAFGPYVQSERRDLYKQYALELVEKKEAYYCFCTKERLDMLRDNAEAQKKPFKYDKHCCALSVEEVEENLKKGLPYVIRQNNPTEGVTKFEDVIYGTISVDNEELEDMVLLKSDGLPTYNFANVVDDHLMEITHVVRGSEYLSSSPKYNRLYEAFGWNVPVYVHCPPIMKDAQHKLSKRTGDASFEDLLEKGYLKEAVMNYISLLGWNPGTTQEIFSLEELVEIFNYKNINKSPAIFDSEKLRWMNGEYLKMMPLEEFHTLALPYILKDIKEKPLNTMKIAEILHNRVEVLAEIEGQLDFFYALPEYSIELYTHKKMKTDSAVALSSLETILPVLENIPEDAWTLENLHEIVLNKVKELGLKNGQMLWPIRTALSGKQFTPGGAFEAADILGKTESLERIRIGMDLLKKELQ
ncbi:glutamate--tRNA ligase [Proteiniclasticum ruminis]|uniref:Glutamate--tRNA ligase n=1 Tax=Proteiniclasticum ruminis TaxID=398199 RepID=A0A1I4XWQ6_9CLOT|nr:glutamate--tRNA ligase [Proteiniclasticum ruminis]SFN30298.1 glutamyl-tRNA synthetase [Proteiniclasticum ruminis]